MGGECPTIANSKFQICNFDPERGTRNWQGKPCPTGSAGASPSHKRLGRSLTPNAARRPLLTADYRRGFSTTTASGGKVSITEWGRPWAIRSSAISPEPFPRLLPV
jgi:hypothetical protein